MIIDFEEMAMAFEDHNAETAWYFDRETGDAIPVMNDFGIGEPDEEMKNIEDNPERYVLIEPIESRIGFGIMEDFVMDLPEGEAKRILDKALAWKKPFSNFKSALYDYPELRESWFEYHGARLKEIIMEWLADNNIPFEQKGKDNPQTPTS